MLVVGGRKVGGIGGIVAKGCCAPASVSADGLSYGPVGSVRRATLGNTYIYNVATSIYNVATSIYNVATSKSQRVSSAWGWSLCGRGCLSLCNRRVISLYARKIIRTICAMRMRRNMASGYTVL